MKFIIDNKLQRGCGRLCYFPSEFSIMTIGRDGDSFTSVLINDLQIELSSSGCAISVWGMIPHTNWIPGKINPPIAADGVLKTNEKLTPGVSIRLNDRTWPVVYDQESGWIFVGSEIKDPVEVVEFLVDCKVAISNQNLIGIWLRPEIKY